MQSMLLIFSDLIGEEAEEKKNSSSCQMSDLLCVCAQVHFTLSGIKLRNLRLTIFLPAFSHTPTINVYQCMNFLCAVSPRGEWF